MTTDRPKWFCLSHGRAGAPHRAIPNGSDPALHCQRTSAGRRSPYAKLQLMKAPVLIIDGDGEHSATLLAQLKHAGYEVITASTSAAGLEAAESFSTSGIMTD